MSNTYTQFHLHFVFAPKYRAAVIHPSWEVELHKYITAIVQNEKNKHKMLVINGMSDHIHMLIGMRPHQSVSDLIQEVKAASTRWINDSGKTRSRFEWQRGFGGFSYSKSDIPNVINYIKNQKEHHRKKFFRDEYEELLKKFEIEYDERYIFHEPV